MLELNQSKQLKDLNELKSHQTPRFIVLPEDLKAHISYKTLLNEATWSDLSDNVSVFHVLKDQSCYFSSVDEFALIDLTEIFNIVMIDYDDEEREEFIFNFENRKTFETFLDQEDYRISDATYLELDNQTIDELAVKTREAQLEYYDRKIAKAELDIKLATKALKEFEELKEKLMNKGE